MQQEGDRSWLPLESPDVEILEGRYRVMVKNVAPNAVMDIRITHESTAEDPPKRRTQVRSGKSNPMGLLVVIPFTQMQPGIWELACVPNDLMSDLLGHQGHYSVQLHVLPKESDVAGEWEPDWSQPNAAVSSTESINPASTALNPTAPIFPPPPPPLRSVPVEPLIASPVVTKGPEPESSLSDTRSLEQAESALIDRVALPVEPELALETAEADLLAAFEALDSRDPLSAPEPIVSGVPAIPEPVIPELQPEQPSDLQSDRQSEGQIPVLIDRSVLALKLQPDSYDIEAAQTVMVTGILTADASSEPVGQRSARLMDCTFVVRVRDPQQGNTVVETAMPFPQIVLPFEMQIGVTLPEQLPGQMLLGEVCLMADATEEVLVRQSFTFFAQMDQVLAAIAQDLNPQIRPPALDELPHPPAEPSGPDFDDQFLGMINQTANPTVAFQSKASPEMPPKLYQPDPDRPVRSAPTLPTFLSSPTAARGGELSENLDLVNSVDLVDSVAANEMDGLELSFDDEDDVADLTAESGLTDPTVPSSRVSEDQLLAEVPTLAVVDRGTANFEMTEAELSHLFDDGLEEALAEDEDEEPIDPLFNTTAPLDLDDPDDLKTIDIQAHAMPDRFESLNLADRFMDRMSAFAEETHAEATQAIPPTPQASVNPFASVVGHAFSPEAVIMDDVVPIAPASSVLGENPLLIPESELVPTPRLEMAAVDEVVAGQSLIVKVKLPLIQPKLYVKLWINDRQTRTLLDGPRYLVDFVADPLQENLEAVTQLTVPLGSLEIQIEAIAIETATKRESYKSSSALVVVPPNLPRLEGDDFGF